MRLDLVVKLKRFLWHQFALASCDFHIFFFSGFQTLFYQMRWFYRYHSFKRSQWWRHKLGHT